MSFAAGCCACDNVDREEESFQAQLTREGRVSYEPAPDPMAGSALEKSRLQEFVKDFAKCAVRGVACEVIDAETGTPNAATYYIDPALQRLTLKLTPKLGRPSDVQQQSVDMCQIQDVLDYEAAKGRLPEASLRGLQTGDVRDRLVAIITLGGPATVILEGSPVDRERFVMCLKILRLYAQTLGSGERLS